MLVFVVLARNPPSFVILVGWKSSVTEAITRWNSFAWPVLLVSLNDAMSFADPSGAASAANGATSVSPTSQAMSGRR